MKKIYIILIGFLSMTSCSNFLDVVPDNVATLENAFTMRNTAERYLFTCYSYLPTGGSLTSDPAMLAGGDLWPLYRATTSAARFARGEQSLVDPLLNYWDGRRDGNALYQGIRDCNTFLENIQAVPDMANEEKLRWSAEVKFLKAYYHFYLLRMYGPIPLMKNNLPIDASLNEVRVFRETTDEGFDYIVELIDESLDHLPLEIDDVSSESGRITKLIALAVKAQVLTTAASPLFNGNTDYANEDVAALFNPNYDEGKWRVAADALKEAIDVSHSLGLKLYQFQPGIQKLSDTTIIQLSIRNAITERWNSEIIWANTNTVATQSAITPRTWDPDRNHSSMQGRYGSPIEFIDLYYTDNGLPINEDIEWNYNDRLVLKTAGEEDRYNIKKGYTTAGMHFNRDNRFYASIGFDGGIWYGQGKFDDNNTWHLEGKSGQFTSRQIADRYSPTGYWPKKLINFQNVIGASSYSVTSYYWPNIRLADLYLLYAEALNEYGGSSSDIHYYLDLIRERAGLPKLKDAWENYSRNPGKINTKEGMREVIHQERQIELALEGKRYWDLLRWKKAHVELNKPVLGWDLLQTAAEYYYRETPVFQRDFSMRDYFWPIRENNIITNRNLVQNPGW